MIARFIFRVRAGVLTLLLLGCAQSVDDVGTASVNGAKPSTCANGSCNGCSTCFNMCMCGGSNAAHCTSICATGSGGASSTGGSGGSSYSGGSGGYDAGVGGSSFGGTGGGSSCGVSIGGDPNCNSCMQSLCCNAAESCAFDQNCMALMDCVTQAPECASAVTLTELLDCGDTACPNEAPAKPLLSGYLTCLTTTCGASCGI